MPRMGRVPNENRGRNQKLIPRCISFVQRGCVSVSPFIRFFLVLFAIILTMDVNNMVA